MKRNVRQAPRDDRSRAYNRGTQPLRDHPIFNNPAVIGAGWYPLLASATLPPGQVRSVNIATQRIAVWRDPAGLPHAVDAFCPHMGADLGNGRVTAHGLECYFHQWRYGADGALLGVRCGDAPDGVRLRAWPVTEGYGFVWAWAGDAATHPLPRPPGLEEGPLAWWYIRRVRLMAHHHVMMAGGIDVQHFATVHGLSADLEVAIEEGPDVADWHVRGPIPDTGWRARLSRAVVGGSFSYRVRFGGASTTAITWLPDARLRGDGRPLPAMHALWGAAPHERGASDAHLWLVTRGGPGVTARLTAQLRLAMTAGLLAILTDDDVQAFPWMRFQTGRLVPLDESVGRLARFLNRQPPSPWSGAAPAWPYDP